jgi:hypothetical protein
VVDDCVGLLPSKALGSLSRRGPATGSEAEAHEVTLTMGPTGWDAEAVVIDGRRVCFIRDVVAIGDDPGQPLGSQTAGVVVMSIDQMTQISRPLPLSDIFCT